MLQQPYRDRSEIGNHPVKHLRLRLHSFRQLIETEDVDSEDSMDDLQTRVRSKSCESKVGRDGWTKLTMIPKENISDALPMRIPACASGLCHMTLQTWVPEMAWPSITLAALSQSATFTRVTSTSSLGLTVYMRRILLDFKSTKLPSAIRH